MASLWMLSSTKSRRSILFNHLGNAIDTLKIMNDFYLQEISMLKILNHVYQSFFFSVIQSIQSKKKHVSKVQLTNHSCIHLVLTKFSSSFQNTCTITAGLSGFHKLVIIVMKMTFQENLLKKCIAEIIKKKGKYYE